MKTKLLIKILLFLLILLLIGMTCATAEGNVARVDNEEYATLQAAIDAVPDTDSTILLLTDTIESINTNGKSFTLNLDGHTLTAASNQRAYMQTGGAVTVKNGTITGGSASGSDDDGRGGGVYITDGTLTMDSVTICKNKASVDGGGLYADNSTVTLEYCQITENVASGEIKYSTITAGGGGIALHTGVTLTATNTNILQNEATNGTGSGIAIGIGEIIYLDAGNTVTLNNCKISDNIARDEDGGSAVMLQQYSILEATNLKISENRSSVTDSTVAAGLDVKGKATLHENCIVEGNQGYIGGISVRDYSVLIAEDGLIVNRNSGNLAGGMHVSLMNSTQAEIRLNGARFEGNTATGNDGTGGLYFGSLGTTTFSLENCEFTNNTGATGALFANNQEAQLTIRNCAFFANTGTQYAGAITEMMRGKWLNLYNNTITNNIGYKAGGLYGRYEDSHHYGINLGSGNIVYNNTSMDGNGGNDIAIDQTRYTSLLAANSMGNSASQFAGWTWIGGTGTATLSVGESINSSSSYYKAPNALYFTAGVPNEVAQNVTNNDKPTYYTLQNAITSAASGDTIWLIGEKDDLVESAIVNKEITLNLNDHALSSVSGAALTVESTGNLTLTGTGSVSSIKNAGGQVTVNADMPVDELILAENSFMTVGSAFAPNAMEIVLDDDVLQSLNKGYQSDSSVVVTLLEPLAGETLNPALLTSVTVKDANGYVFIEINADGKLVARSSKLNGVYVNGETGSDTNSGLSADAPVKTFAHAKEVLEVNSDAVGIYVTGKLTVSNNETWTLPVGKSLIRYPNYFGYLVEVSGTLTLQDIVLDGSSQQKVNALAALVHVTQNGVLNIENGAVLQNNNHAASNYTMPGGAVYGSGGTVNMSGGVIEGNSSWFGGGIAMNGGLLNLTGGIIRTNSAKDRSDFHAIGGGVALLNDARMSMDGGTISGNSSENTGGGIAVGGVNSNTIGKATLNMTDGKISDNVSAWEGGGIYIQAEAVGKILGGKITDNQSNNGYFGGGGIYVNGAREDTDGASFDQGELYLQNVIITDNSAQRAGGGLAGCGSSTTNIYVGNGGAIYGNQDGDGAQQIYIDGGLVTTIYGSTPHAVVSGYMLDGTPYNWTDRNSKLISLDTLSRISGTIHLNNDHTADKTGLGAVRITGNSAVTRGGGIGSNGFVQIGTVPTEGSWTPEATKTLIGRDMMQGEFTFEVQDENGAVVSTGYNLAAANGQPAQIVFTPIVFDGLPLGWELTYTIKEVQSSLPAYVTGVENSFTVDVTVIEGPDGKLTGAVSSESPAGAFQNVYTPMEGAWTPEGTKTLIGRDMIQGEFRFEVHENGRLVSTGYAQAAGDSEAAQIVFTPISFDGESVGTRHTYVITERQDAMPMDITGDSRSYTVEVTVVLGADGRLKGEVSASSPKVYFENRFAPPVPNLPQTGDNSHIALWGILLALSASCMFVILNKRRLGGER